MTVEYDGSCLSDRWGPWMDVPCPSLCKPQPCRSLFIIHSSCIRPDPWFVFVTSVHKPGTSNLLGSWKNYVSKTQNNNKVLVQKQQVTNKNNTNKINKINSLLVLDLLPYNNIVSEGLRNKNKGLSRVRKGNAPSIVGALRVSIIIHII